MHALWGRNICLQTWWGHMEQTQHTKQYISNVWGQTAGPYKVNFLFYGLNKVKQTKSLYRHEKDTNSLQTDRNEGKTLPHKYKCFNLSCVCYLSALSRQVMLRTSTTPSSCSCRQPIVVAMKQPVRPIPALQAEERG